MGGDSVMEQRGARLLAQQSPGKSVRPQLLGVEAAGPQNFSQQPCPAAALGSPLVLHGAGPPQGRGQCNAGYRQRLLGALSWASSGVREGGKTQEEEALSQKSDKLITSQEWGAGECRKESPHSHPQVDLEAW